MAAAGPVVVATDRLGPTEPDGVIRTRIAVASADPALRLQLRRLLPSAQGFEMVGAARFGGLSGPTVVGTAATGQSMLLSQKKASA